MPAKKTFRARQYSATTLARASARRAGAHRSAASLHVRTEDAEAPPRTAQRRERATRAGALVQRASTAARALATAACASAIRSGPETVERARPARPRATDRRKHAR